MIIRNPNTGHRFYLDDDRNEFATYAFKGFIYENTENGIVFKEEIDKSKLLFEKYISADRWLSAIEIDEDDNIKIYPEPGVKYPMVFNVLTLSFDKETVIYKEKKIDRNNSYYSLAIYGSLNPVCLNKEESIAFYNRLLDNFAERYKEINIKDIMVDYRTAYDTQKVYKSYVLSMFDTLKHVASCEPISSSNEFNAIYINLVKKGFAPFILNIAQGKKKDEIKLKEIKEFDKYAKNLTINDMEPEIRNLINKYYSYRTCMFKLWAKYHFNYEDFKSFLEIFNQFIAPEIKTFDFLYNYCNKFQHEKNLKNKDVFNKINSIRTVENSNGEERYLSVYAPVELIKKLAKTAGKNKAVSLFQLSDSYEDLSDALRRVSDEYCKEQNKNRDILLKEILEPSECHNECVIPGFTRIFPYLFKFEKVNKIGEKKNCLLDNLILDMVDLDRHDLLFYIYEKDGNGAGVLRVNMKNKQVKPFLIKNIDVLFKNVDMLKLIEEFTEVGKKYTDIFHNIFLNRFAI